MWNAFISGNYFMLQNGNKLHRRLSKLVEVRKPTVNGTTYIFCDRYDEYLTVDFTELRDENGDPFADQATFEDFIITYTGSAGGSLSAIAVDSANFAPNYDEGESVPFSVDKDNGAERVNQGDLDHTQDNVLNLIGATDSTHGMVSRFRSTELLGNKVLISANPVNLCGWHIINPTEDPVYLKLWNANNVGDVVIGGNGPFKIIKIDANDKETIPPLVRMDHFSVGIVGAIILELATSGTTPPDSGVYVELYTGVAGQ